MISRLLEDRKIRILIAFVLISVLIISTRGITTGLDLQGGSKITIQTERPLNNEEMGQVVSIMTKRLNGLGLKDVRIRPWGDEFIIIEVAGSNPRIEDILEKIGILDVKVGNITVFTGADLERVEAFRKNPLQNSWEVPFTINEEGAKKFRDIALKTNFSEVSMFMDEGTAIMIIRDRSIMPRIGFTASKGYLFDNDPLMDAVNKGILGIKFKTNEDLRKKIKEELDIDAEVGEIEIDNVVVGEYIVIGETMELLGEDKIKKIKEFFNATGIKEEDILIGSTGLVNHAPIGAGLREELFIGNVVRSLILETGSDEDARLEAEEVEVVLRSGSLPIKVDIKGKYGVPPELGEKFTRNAIVAGLFAMMAVAVFIFVRYRTPKIVVPILITGLSEVTIILGVASIIKWNIDLPAIAGIIAAVGTGVDDQIVITDEVLMEKTKSIRYRIKNAFFIIMTAWATTVAAMVPLIVIGMGMLVGFAIITIIGVTIGVFITRPAYARMIQHLVG